MPRTVDNIGFYGGMGFQPHYLTLTMTKKVTRSDPDSDVVLLSALDGEARAALIRRCAQRLRRSAEGYDFTRVFELTSALGLGDTVVIDRRDVCGFAVWHSAPLAADTPADDLRVLKLFADSDVTLGDLLAGLEQCAVDAGLQSVSIRCQTAQSGAFRVLMRNGYRVRWTDLRMTLSGFPEADPPEGETLFSNWEI